MAGMLESVATFKARVTALGLDSVWEKFEAAGWSTYATFGFAVYYVPGTPDDSKFVSGVLLKLFEGEDDQRAPAVRRLFFEAYTLFVSDMKTRMDRTDESAPRKMVVPERESRRKRLADRLHGLELTGELDVAHSLVDKCVQMAEDDVLSYIPWDICAKRGQELRGHKIIKEFKPDAKGFMKEQEVPHTHKAELNSDLRLEKTLQRRGIALDMANMITFEVHEKLVRHLMKSYMAEPPKNFRSIDMDQLRRADEVLFSLMVDATRNGIKPKADGTLPLDAALLSAMGSHEFFYALAPLQGGGGGKSSGKGKKRAASRSLERDPSTRTKNQKRASALKETKRQLEEAKAELSRVGGLRPKAGQPHRPGKAESNQAPKMPQKLIGMNSTHDGRPICFGYNLGNCRQGASCTRLHVCCKPGCGASHPLADHKN